MCVAREGVAVVCVAGEGVAMVGVAGEGVGELVSVWGWCDWWFMISCGHNMYCPDLWHSPMLRAAWLWSHAHFLAGPQLSAHAAAHGTCTSEEGLNTKVWEECKI